MSFVDQVAGGDVLPEAGQAISSGMTKGLDAGLAYAAAKNTSDEMGQKLQQMKDDHAAKKSAYLMDGLVKATSQQNKPLKGIMLDEVAKNYTAMNGGATINPSWLDFAKNVPTAFATFSKLNDTYKNASTDPNTHALWFTKAQEMLGNSYMDAGGPGAEIMDQDKSINAAKAAADNRAAVLANTGRRLDQRDTTIGQGAARLELSAGKNAQNAAPVQDATTQMYGANKGLGIINQGISDYKTKGETVTWGQLADITTDYAGLSSAKVSATIPEGRRKSIEQDIPVVSELLGKIDREAKQGSSKTVPIATLNQMKDQFETLKRVVTVYRDEQMKSRTDMAVKAGAMKQSTADSIIQNGQQQGQGSQPNTIPTPTPQGQSGAMNRAATAKSQGLSYSDLQRRVPSVAAQVSEQDYNSIGGKK
jgi:hypothetical protein